MIKELKYFFFIVIIFLFIFFTSKYYFSDENKKRSYRLYKKNDEKIFNFSQKLSLLESNTEQVVEYVEKKIDKSKKNYKFWKLIGNNE